MPTITRSEYIDSRYHYQSLENGTLSQVFDAGSLILEGTSSITKEGPVSGYRELIANGLNATSNLNGNQKSLMPPSSDITFQVQSTPSYPGTKQLYRMHLWGNYPFPSASAVISDIDSLVSKTDNLAISRLYSNLAGVHSAFKGMVFAGELSESLRMILHPARGLRKGVSDYLNRVKRLGPKKKRFDRPSFVRDTWLEYSFGWSPLISDLDGAVNAFFNSRLVEPLFTMVRGNATLSEPETPLARTQFAGFGHNYHWKEQLSKTVSIKYYGVYRSTGKGSLSHSFGFSPWEFVPTLWELVPYSFLVDYFTNIGDIVSSWSYRTIGLEFLSRGIEKRANVSVIDPIVKLDPSSSYADTRYWRVSQSGSLGSSSRYSREIERVRSYGLPTPKLELQVPGMGPKWVNIAALSNQLSSGRRALRS